MAVTLTERCLVCGSAVCLHFSPYYCRTTNQHRPVKTESISVETPKKATPKQMPRKKGGS